MHIYRNTIRKAGCAVLAVLILCASGCYTDMGGGTDAPDPEQADNGSAAVTTTERTLQTSNAKPELLQLGDRLGECFIAPDPDLDPYGAEHYNSYNCEPGYIYFEQDVYGRIILLLDKKFKSRIGVYQTSRYIYAVSEDNRLIKTDKMDGSYEVIYTAKYGSINVFSYSNSDGGRVGEPEARLFYINDGNYVVQIEKDTGKTFIVPYESRGGVSDIYGVGRYLQGYACQYCVYDKDYIVWKDRYRNIFWYHPETKEIEPLVLKNNLYWDKADPNWHISDSDIEINYPPLDGRTGPCSIATTHDSNYDYMADGQVPGWLYFNDGVYNEYAPYLLLAMKFNADIIPYQNDDYVYAVTDNNDLCKVNKHDGSYEILHNGIAAFAVCDRPGNDTTHCFLYSDGENIMRMNAAEDDEIKFIVHSNVGVEEIHYFDWKFIEEENSDKFDLSLLCSECKYSPEQFIWKDANGVYYWYHPERDYSEKLDYSALMMEKND